MKDAILLVDHGSRRPEANALIEELARRLRQRLPERVIAIAHLEIARPNVREGIEACLAQGATQIVVHPYFLGPGRHTTHDIPAEVERATRTRPDVQVKISEPLGLHPSLIDVVVDRVSETEIADK